MRRDVFWGRRMVSESKTTDIDTGLRGYELTLIINAQLGEEAYEAAIDKYSRLITAKGGIVTDTQRWGKKRLAYPIKHIGEGNYVLFKLRMKPAASRELEATLRISEDVMRHLLVKMED